MENSNIDLGEINRSLQQSFIHYDPDRIDFTVSNIELELLEQSGSSIWKDIFLATTGIGIPTLLNGYCDYLKLTEKAPLTGDIFINFLVAGICLTLAIICLIVWQKNKSSFKSLINQIKNKPKYRLPGKT